MGVNGLSPCFCLNTFRSWHPDLVDKLNLTIIRAKFPAKMRLKAGACAKISISKGKCQTVCKPGSVSSPLAQSLATRGDGDDHSSGMPVARHLTRPTRAAVRKQTAERLRVSACRPYLVLLQVGFAMPSALPRPRWALTPPFQPCRGPKPGWRSVFCFTFPGVAPAGRYPAPLLPWSPDFPRRRLAQRARKHRGRPTVWHGRVDARRSPAPSTAAWALSGAI